MEQDIRFCTTSDGVRIAYATVGEGPPLVRVLGWFTHLEFDWNAPWTKAYVAEMASRYSYIRYDGRGVGLSDREITDFSVDCLVKDLEAVVDAVGFEKVALWGISQGGPVAITYAAHHPERVSHLALQGTFARVLPPKDEKESQLRQAMMTMVRDGWGSDNPMYRQVFASIFLPKAEAEQISWFTELQRVSTSPESAFNFLTQLAAFDVTGLLPGIQAPTIVFHSRGDRAAPFDGGRELAASIPNARFVPLESDNHVLLDDEPASEVFRQTFDEFVIGSPNSAEVPASPSGLVTILFTDIEGSTALTQHLGDAKAQELLHTHNTIVRDSLKAHDGSEIKHTGDGIMASFGSARGALESAIAIQRAFEKHNEGNPDAQVHVRVGLNAGEPVAEDGDLFGTAVQLAARVCAYAEPGQIVIPDGLRHLVAGKDFLFADLGISTLKGFEDPVRLFNLRWRSE